MIEVIFDVAATVFLSSKYCKSVYVLLKRASEIDENKKVDYFRRAKNMKLFFESKDSISELVEKTFKTCLEDHGRPDTRLLALLKGIKDYKFWTHNPGKIKRKKDTSLFWTFSTKMLPMR